MSRDRPARAIELMIAARRGGEKQEASGKRKRSNHGREKFGAIVLVPPTRPRTRIVVLRLTSERIWRGTGEGAVPSLDLARQAGPTNVQ